MIAEPSVVPNGSWAELEAYYSAAEAEWQVLCVDAKKVTAALHPAVRRTVEQMVRDGLATAQALRAAFQGSSGLIDLEEGRLRRAVLVSYKDCVSGDLGELSRRRQELAGVLRDLDQKRFVEKATSLQENQLLRLRDADLEVPRTGHAPVATNNATPVPAVSVPHRSSEVKAVASERQAVVLVHGIRTEAPWAEMVNTVLSADPRLEVVPFRYGYFDLIRFLWPFWTRTKPVRRLDRIIREIASAQGTQPTIIAHSFGTYAICRLLDEEPTVKLKGLILCGGIVPQDFRWDRVREQVKWRVLNDCGVRDFWPLLASASTWGYGPSGVFGFGTYKVQDRFHDFPHSGFFDPAFVRDFWLPYVSNGDILPSVIDPVRKTPPLWQSHLARLPIRWILAVPVALLFIAVIAIVVMLLVTLVATVIS